MVASFVGSATTSMLLAFRAENVRSFRDPLEFTFEATALSEPGVSRDVPWREDGRHPVRVLPAAGVFGANASGKTNLLRAMDDMRRIVLTSFRSGDSSGRRMYRRPFRLDPATESTPSRFEIDLVLSGIRHEYEFVVDDTRVLYESARRFPRGRPATLFRRHGDELELGESNRAKGRAVGEILRPNSLYLSAAAAASHPDLLPLYEWFEANLIFADASSRSRRWAYTTHLLAHEDRREQILALLHAADLGITDAHVRELDPQTLERLRKAVRILTGSEDDPETTEIDTELLDLGVVLSHQGAHGNVELQSEDESLGTLVWFGLAGPVVGALAQGAVLLADEIESSLHPALVAQLVRTFQSQESNPNDAQLIFNSHEASLLGDSVSDRVLGRDQVWFTEKLHDGSTRLYPLTDLNPRRDEAISRRYLAGRYGATPIVSSTDFATLMSGNPSK
jgi:predicted ATPase